MGGEPNTYTDADVDDIIAEKDARIAALEAALRRCMIGGNHLPMIFGVDHPHAGVDHEVACAFFGYGHAYEAWCCWNAIMQAGDVLDGDSISNQPDN